jgi:hypothetical protein
VKWFLGSLALVALSLPAQDSRPAAEELRRERVAMYTPGTAAPAQPKVKSAKVPLPPIDIGPGRPNAWLGLALAVLAVLGAAATVAMRRWQESPASVGEVGDDPEETDGSGAADRRGKPGGQGASSGWGETGGSGEPGLAREAREAGRADPAAGKCPATPGAQAAQKARDESTRTGGKTPKPKKLGRLGWPE